MNVTIGTFEPSEKAIKLVNTVLHSGRISYGPMCRAFENKFSELHGCRYGVLSNSGTSSLQVALQAMKEIHGWDDGDEVLVPAATFVATINIVLHNRMLPVLVDVEKQYFAMNPALIERYITPRTRAIIPVHPFGQPADISTICDIAAAHGLKVIEDSCECMFVSHKGRPVGSFGDISCFSMYVAHLLTCGIGGIAITDSEEYAIKMRSLANHGRNNIYISIDDNVGRGRLREVIEKRFLFESLGHSYRITEMEAALALAQLDTYNDMLAKREYNANALAAVIDRYPALERLGRRPDTDCAWMMFPIVAVETSKRRLVCWLEDHGIETRDALPVLNQPVYNGMFDADDYPVAQYLLSKGFYIGCHQGLNDNHINHVDSVLMEYFHKSHD